MATDFSSNLLHYPNAQKPSASAIVIHLKFAGSWKDHTQSVALASHKVEWFLQPLEKSSKSRRDEISAMVLARRVVSCRSCSDFKFYFRLLPLFRSTLLFIILLLLSFSLM